MLFSDDADERLPKTALLLLHKMRLRTTEDVFASYPLLFDTPPDADEYKRLSAAMRAAGAAMGTPVEWRVDESTEPGASQAPQLRRILLRANQQQRASLTFDRATAQREADKIQARENQVNAATQHEQDAQLSLKLHVELVAMVNYKIPPSEQATPKVTVRLYNAFNNGTLCAADLSIKKFVLRSQTGDMKEKETKIGEDGELTIRSREEDTVNCGSLSDVLVALETRGNTLMASGFRPVRPVPGMTGMYTRGEHGWQFYDKVADPHNAGVMVSLEPPGFWYYFDPQAAKKYQMMMLHSLRIRHVQDLVVGDGLMMEQIVNKVGEGFNLSSAMIDTLDSTTMTQLLQASGHRLLRPINGQPIPGVGHQKNGDNGAGRGTKRAVPNG